MFFDRDGVLNASVVRNGRPYPPKDRSELAFEDGAEHAVKILASRIPMMFVVSNQPDVARGTQSRECVEELNALVAQRFPISQFYMCYHDDADGCGCRKPLPGLLLRAAEEHGVDLSESYMIGDRWKDVAAGKAAGCTTILIDRNYDEPAPGLRPDTTVTSLAQAAAFILHSESSRGIAARV